MKMKTIALYVKWACIEIGKEWQRQQVLQARSKASAQEVSGAD